MVKDHSDSMTEKPAILSDYQQRIFYMPERIVHTNAFMGVKYLTADIFRQVHCSAYLVKG